MTDFETPNIDFSNRDAALQQIWSFVLSFQEQVSFWLRNLDKDSFNEQGLKEITEPITAQIQDVAGNVTELQVTAEGLQSQVTEADGKASSAKQTADGVKVEVTGLSDEVTGLQQRSTVTIDSTGLYVTNAAGNTTKLSGNHITSGTIEGVKLISKGGSNSVTISDGQIELQYGSGTTVLNQTVSGIKISSNSYFGGGFEVDMNTINLSGPTNIFGSLSAADATVTGDLNIARNINSSGAMKLNAGGNASIDSGGTIYIGASSGCSGNVSIGQSGGTVNLKGTVMVNGKPL